MKNLKLFTLIFLILFVQLSSQEVQAEENKENPNEKSKHYVFRSDMTGYEVISGRFTHVFVNFYKGSDIDTETEAILDKFGSDQLSEHMIILAMSMEHNESLVEQFNVDTSLNHQLVLVRNGIPIKYEKNLAQNQEDFNEWAVDQLTPKIHHIQNEEDLQILLKQYEENTAIYYKAKNDITQFQTIKSYIQKDIFQQNYVPKVFYYDIVEDNKNSTLLVLKKSEFDEEKVYVYMDDISDEQSVIDFLRVSTLKALTVLEDETYLNVFGNVINTQVLLFKSKNEENNDKIMEIFKKTALYNVNEQLSYQRGIFTIIENSQQKQDLYQLFQIDQNSDFPKIVVTKTDHSKFSLNKYNFTTYYNDEFTQENIIQFIEDVQLKKVDPYYQSEEVLEYKGDKKIRKIVGQNFREEVYKQPISYLVLFWDSKDPYSSVSYEKLLEQFIENYGDRCRDILKIGKFDLNLNENELVNLDSAPQLIVYPKQDKRNPQLFKYDVQNLDNLKVFLRQWVQNIDLEEKKEPLSLGGGSEKIEL